MDVNDFVKSRMRESRTSGSVRDGHREVLVYSIFGSLQNRNLRKNNSFKPDAPKDVWDSYNHYLEQLKYYHKKEMNSPVG